MVTFSVVALVYIVLVSLDHVMSDVAMATSSTSRDSRGPPIFKNSTHVVGKNKHCCWSWWISLQVWAWFGLLSWRP